MDSQQALDHVFSLAREHRLKHVDAILSRDEDLSIMVLNGRVEKVDQSTGLGLGVRVVQEGRTGIAYTERLEEGAIERAFLAAKENAVLMDPTQVVMQEAFPPVPDPVGLKLYNPDLDELTFDDLAAFALEAEATAQQADGRVKSVPHSAVARSMGTYRVVSSHGMDYSQRANKVGAYCSVLLEENGRSKSGGHSWGARVWEPERGKLLGEEAVRNGADLFGAKKIPGGKIPIVLDEYCAPRLLGMFFGSFSAEAAQKEQSRLKGRVGQRIAGEAINLLDDPHMVGGPGSRYLDAEGTPTQPMPLIEGGVFRNFLYHIESARKEGRESTGHAGRKYSGGISTRSHNLVMPTGPYTLEALIALPEKCLLVTELEGGAGCNGLSGDISIGVQGFLVEQGRRVQPVEGVTIAGNFFDLLNQIVERGNFYQPNLSTLFIPPVLVEGLVVAS